MTAVRLTRSAPTVCVKSQVPLLMQKQNFCALMGNKLGLYIPHAKPGKRHRVTVAFVQQFTKEGARIYEYDVLLEVQYLVIHCGRNVPDLRRWNAIVAKLDSAKVIVFTTRTHLWRARSCPRQSV